MMFQTRYPNNSRIVSGTPQLFNDDSILLCDTSINPVVINLLEIPDGYWNTTWKLYVVDNSNNAGTNSITINAGPGQTINGGASTTINISGGCALIRIVTNNQFIATFSYGGALSGHVIEDEGVALPQRPILNFIGAGVTAYDLAGKTVVEIPGVTIVSLTNAAMLTLINTNSVIPGQLYQISDAIFITTYFATQETVPIIVQGVSVNSVSLEGQGIFLNADYQQVGNYSGVAGFVANKGVWIPSVANVVGDVVMWNNMHWVNTTGVNTGVNPKNDAINWAMLPKSLTNGYIQEIDFITYDVQANTIRTRKDKRNNYVENNFAETSIRAQAFNVFQWGNNKVAYNSVTQSSILECWNYNVIGGTFVNITEIGMYGNTLNNRASLQFATEGGVFGVIKFNTLSNTSDVSLFSYFEGVFENCTVENSRLEIATRDTNDIIQNSYFFNSTVVMYLTNTLAGYLSNVVKNSTINIPDMKGLFSENVITNSTVQCLIVRPLAQISNNTITNSVVKGTATPNVQDFYGLMAYNVIEDSLLEIDTTSGDSEIVRNYIQQQSRISVRDNAGKLTYNEVQNSSVIEIADNSGEITYNEVKNQSIIQATQNIGTIGAVPPKSTGNRVLSKSRLSFDVNNALIYNSIFDLNTAIQITTNNADFAQVHFDTVQISLDTNNGTFLNLTCDVGAVIGAPLETNTYDFANGDSLRGQYNSIEIELDMNDPAIYDLPTQTLFIPSIVKNFAGKFKLKNASAQVIKSINSLSSQWYTEISCDTSTIVFTISPIVPLVPYYIVATQPVASYTITGRTTPQLADSLVLKSPVSSQVNGVIEARIYV